MKTRRHHNTKGTRQIQRGKTRTQVAAMAKRLGVTESIVRDVPGHPVAATCTIMHCQYFDLMRALQVIYATARTDEKGEYWTIRKYLDDYGVYHGNLSSLERLIEEVCKLVFHKIGTDDERP